jgi:hypothetical protein
MFVGKGNIVSATEITLGKQNIFPNLLGNIFASGGPNSVSTARFLMVGKHSRKY